MLQSEAGEGITAGQPRSPTLSSSSDDEIWTHQVRTLKTRLDKAEVRIEVTDEERASRILEVQGLPQMRLNDTDKHLPTVEEVEGALWRYIRKGAPHQAGQVRELRAEAPCSATIRFETAKHAKKLNIQCKLMEQSGAAPKVANKKISIVEASTEGDRACSKLYASMMSWVTLIFGDTATRKFLVAQKEIHLATRVTKQNRKK